MSSLLERAIIDAKALKESALKNAENLVIEKYSHEIKDAMQKLLEQDADELPGALGGDDLGLDLGDEMGDDLGAMDDMPLEDDAAETEDDAAAKEFADSTVADIPDAFDPDMGDPGDEIISIKLDSLRAELPEEEDGLFGGDDELEDEELGIDITDEDETLDSDEDIDLDLDTDFDLDADPGASMDLDSAFTPEMVAEALSELGLDNEEIDIDDLMERVRVDFEPQKSGWAGTPEPIMREYESMLLAREQDSETKEENEELRKTVASLQEENKVLASAATKLEAQNKQYVTTLETLQEKLESANISNAKLLYISRALENASLNERQKERIVESISKAETIQEAKIIFDTLLETVTSSPAEKKVNSLSEAVSRRSTLLVSAREEQKKGNANPAFERLQRLAGITK
jgi:hypothetical protein